MTYFFTVLETLAATSLLFGLVTWLAAVWGVIEFSIIGVPPLLAGNTEQGLVLALLFSASLLLNGSPTLSLDGLIAKRMKESGRGR